MDGRIEEALERVAETRTRALATLRRAIEIERRVIEENEMLAQTPGHEESARQRIVEARQQLRRMEAELANLEQGEAAADDPSR